LFVLVFADAAAIAGGASAFFLKRFDDDVFIEAVRDALASAA
jgi:DNA-binding NarL/FixJ family response regulator